MGISLKSGWGKEIEKRVEVCPGGLYRGQEWRSRVGQGKALRGAGGAGLPSGRDGRALGVREGGRVGSESSSSRT